MPKAIEIYVEALTGTLKLDANYPLREPTVRFGWDSPKEIWEAMNDTVPGIICSRVRLVQQDGKPIMSVEERTDAAFVTGFREAAKIGHALNQAIESGFKMAEQEISEALQLYSEGRPITESVGWKG